MKKLKYVFLTTIITLVSILNVNASTKVDSSTEAGITIAPKSCSDNLLKYEFTNVTYSNGNWYILDETELESTSSVWNASKYFIELNPSTTYYFYRYVGGSSVNVKIYYFKDDLTLSTEKTSVQLYNTGSFTTPADMKYILFTYYSKPSNALTYTTHFMVSESEGLESYVAYEECVIEPEEPETPIIDSSLDNFYSIFIEKVKTLSNFALENKFVLSAITIIIVFTCLELFIYLFGGGRRR